MHGTRVLFLTVLVIAIVALVAEGKPLFRQSRRIHAPYKWNPEMLAKIKPRNTNANPFQYSGYFNVNKAYGGNMYYVFFPAQNGNQNAPVILWLQGGPGCSSMDGLFIELGPYTIDNSLNLVPNNYTWNKDYHLLFVDNPVGAGFSYVENPEGYVRNEEQMASELYSLLTQFFTTYSQYAPNPFYVFGESYAGKYVPAIAHKIMTQGFKVNLKGIGVGDGLTHPVEQFTTYDSYSFSNGLINAAQRTAVIAYQNNITHLIHAKKWEQAMKLVDVMTSVIVEWGGNFNVYDIRRFGDYDFDNMIKYLALPHVKEMMHTIGHDFHECDAKAYENLYEDMPKSTRHLLINLLEANVPVLLYNGQFDWIINNHGAQTWINNMPWTGRLNFLAAKRTVWNVNGNVAGYHQSFQNLHQVIVSGAGHLSPMDQPAQLKDMVTRFIEGRKFD